MPEAPTYLFAVGAACLLLALGLAVFAVASSLAEPFDPSAARNIFDAPGGVNLLIMGWVTSWPQRWAHRSMLVGLVLLGALLSALGERRSRDLVDAAARSWAPLAIALWIAAMLGLAALGPPEGFEFLRIEPRRGLGWAVGVLVTGGLFLLGRRLVTRGASRVFLALTLLLLAGSIVPGLLGAEDLTRLHWNFIEEWQYHYEILFGPADRLAAGLRIGEGVVPLYGIAAPVLLAGVQRHSHAWTLGDYVLLVQAAQLAFFSMLLPVQARYAGGRWALVVPAFALAALDFHFHTYLLMYPNLMGLRFLGFPLAFLAWWAAERRTERRATLLLGGVAGACLLYNLETGVAVTAALAVCALLRRLGSGRGSVRGWIVLALRFAAGIGLATAVLLLLHRALLGAWIEPRSLGTVVWHMLVRSEGGFGAGKPTYDPLAFVIFGHAAAVLITLWIERRRRLSFRRGVRAIAATLIVVWSAYYALRPNLGSLTSLYAPYGFLLLDLLRVVVLGPRGLSLGRLRLGLCLGILALLVVPRLVLGLRFQAPEYLEGIERALAGPPEGALLVQGVYLPDDARTRRILAQGAYLRAQDPAGRPVYLTVDNYLVPKVAGVWPDLPLQTSNAFWGTFTADQYRGLLRTLRRPGLETIYFDSTEGLSREETGLPESLLFYRQLRQHLSGTYVHARTLAGWQEWVRR